MFVPISHDGFKGWVFKFVCPGNAMSITHEQLLMLKNATVNLGFNELCPIHVYIGLGRDHGQFYIDWYWDWDWENEEWKIEYYMLEYPPIEVSDEYSQRSWDWEIQAQFFKSNNITPHWFGDTSLVSLVESQGQLVWTGFMGLIHNNKVDYCPVPKIVNTVALNMFADSSSVIKNPQYHWITRLPDQLPLHWNLLYLFPYDLWILTFVAIFFVSQFMRLSSNIYKKINERVITTELVLIPLRYQNGQSYKRNTIFNFLFSFQV